MAKMVRLLIDKFSCPLYKHGSAKIRTAQNLVYLTSINFDNLMQKFAENIKKIETFGAKPNQQHKDDLQ